MLDLARAATLMLLPSSAAQAQAPVSESHPGYRLATALEGIGCSIQEGNTNLVLFEAGIQPPEFPMMAVALIEDGYLVYSGEGTLTLINWGVCVGDSPLAGNESTEPISE